jgi:hypothetical protein
VVRVLGYRSGGPGSIPGTTRKKSSGSGTGSTETCEYSWGATWWKSSGSCLENREYGRRDLSRWPSGTLYPHKLAITSPTSGGRSVGIVRSRTQTIEFVCCFCLFVVMGIRVPLLSTQSTGKNNCALLSQRITSYREYEQRNTIGNIVSSVYICYITAVILIIKKTWNQICSKLLLREAGSLGRG